MESTHDHAQVIDRLGGPTKVAEILGIIHKPGAVQRVSNWKRRGIPPAVLLRHADVFAARPQPAAEPEAPHA